VPVKCPGPVGSLSGNAEQECSLMKTFVSEIQLRLVKVFNKEVEQCDLCVKLTNN